MDLPRGASASFLPWSSTITWWPEVGDELDIVLDDQEGLAGLVELGQRRLDLADAAGVHAGHRLVEHHDLGMRLSAEASATSFFWPVRQDAGFNLVVAFQSDQLDQLTPRRVGLVDRLTIALRPQELVDQVAGSNCWLAMARLSRRLSRS